MKSQDNNDPQQYRYLKFGLLVTGETEELHLPKLFRALMESGYCTFKVLSRIPQLGRITSEKRKPKLTVTGTNKAISTKHTDLIALPARRHLNEANTYVILVDDLEYHNQEQPQEVFDRYRDILDSLPPEQRHRASVHFLVNMLEAYYLAHAEAVNLVLGTSFANYPGDVETIRNPYSEIKKEYSDFDKKEHGGKIIENLNVEYVLSRPDTCASLRTLFKWCSKCLGESPTDKYQLVNGILNDITKPQIEDIP
ncbi:hypothetical protein [Aerosakkonema funiforme]|uniref:hypothetical protein n=1 Tax=Aerosakkonema funiforme TaxID=1246630 RepID=UPI0035BA2272